MNVRPGAGRAVSVLAALSLTSALLGACGGAKKGAVNGTTPPATTTTQPTSTSKPTKSKSKSKSKSTITTVSKRHGPICPLTGAPPPKGKVPQRQALAVKVENLPAARPQYGLDHADIVVEEPVEGGITRFIVIFQCHNADRIEPVRSGRFVDIDILEPLGKALFAYAGAIQPVIDKINATPWLMPISAMTDGPPTYYRDNTRYAPHNLVSSTGALYTAARLAKLPDVLPKPLFTYGPSPKGWQPASAVHINYPLDVTSWTWDASRGRWVRSYSDTGPGMLGDGTQANAVNVVVMHVHEYPTPYVEDGISHENQLILVGSGQAWVFRDGHVFRCSWFRQSLADPTTFVGRHHEKLMLAPGNTWEELVPETSTVDVSP